jgi:hypothetical protein
MALRRILFQNPTEGFYESFDGTATPGDQLDLNGGRIVGLTTPPTADDEAASKAYVDSVAQGLDIKESCRVCPVSDWSTFVAAGTGVGKTLEAPTDSISFNTQDNKLLVVGQRVLVATAGGDMVTADADNGIYEVTVLGDGAGAKFKVRRCVDFDGSPAGEVSAGAFTFITEGDVNGDKGFVLVTNDPITIDVTPLLFSQFSSTTVYSFDQGLSETSGSIKVELDTAANAQGVGAGGGSSGLEFDVNSAAGKLRAAVSATGGLSRAADGLKVLIDPTANTAGNQPSLAESATGLKTLYAPKTQDNYVANEAVPVKNAVAWAAGVADRLVLARADSDPKSRVIGVAITASSGIGDTIAVVSEGPAVGAIAGFGFAAGDPVYLGDTGSFVSFASVGSKKRSVRVGTAKNTNDLFVDIIDYGKKP